MQCQMRQLVAQSHERVARFTGGAAPLQYDAPERGMREGNSPLRRSRPAQFAHVLSVVRNNDGYAVSRTGQPWKRVSRQTLAQNGVREQLVSRIGNDRETTLLQPDLLALRRRGRAERENTR